ncbi:MAG: choice-of-anchor tandem repeat GloVer-containing protein [Terriglobales bacterium]
MQSLNRPVAGIRWATILLFVVVVYASPARAVTERVLYAFTGLDGSVPSGGLVIDEAGNLYGTTEYGGTFGNGSVFELTPSGGVWTEKVLYSFIGPSDGENPTSGLVFDSAGSLYGTTMNGGDPESQGTVFELSPSGGGWTEKTIYTFDNNPTGDGWAALPRAFRVARLPDVARPAPSASSLFPFCC